MQCLDPDGGLSWSDGSPVSVSPRQFLSSDIFSVGEVSMTVVYESCIRISKNVFFATVLGNYESLFFILYWNKTKEANKR